MMLTDQQLQDFDRDGFIILDNYASTELCDQVRDEIDRLIAFKQLTRESFWHGIRIKDGWAVSKPIRSLALNSQGMEVVSQLIGRPAFAFQTLNFPIGTQQPLHSDTIYFDTMPKGYMAGVWVALEDIDEDNGPLQYCPGSHKLPEITMEQMGLDPGAELYPTYAEFIQKALTDNNIPTVHATIKKGQAFVWHARLLHGGSKQQDPSRSRYSQVTHYFGRSMLYTTPYQNTPKKAVKITHGESYIPAGICDYIG